MAPSNASCLGLPVRFHYLLVFKNQKGYLITNATLDFQHSTEPGAQPAALNRTTAGQWFLDQANPPCGAGMAALWLHCESIPSPVPSGAKGRHCPCWLCQVCAMGMVSLRHMKMQEMKLAAFAIELTLFLHHTDMPLVAKW